jgi:hypothetical protein
LPQCQQYKKIESALVLQPLVSAKPSKRKIFKQTSLSYVDGDIEGEGENRYFDRLA